MAQIIGAIATSHIPAIGKAIAEKRQDEPYWKPFFDGYLRPREWLAAMNELAWLLSTHADAKSAPARKRWNWPRPPPPEPGAATQPP